MARTSDPNLSKMEMVREQMKEFPTPESSEEARDWIRRKYGEIISESTYNVYKSKIQREDGSNGNSGEGQKRRGRKPGQQNRNQDDISLDDIRKLKGLMQDSGLESPLETAKELQPLVEEFGGNFPRFLKALETLDELRSEEVPEPVKPKKGEHK